MTNNSNVDYQTLLNENWRSVLQEHIAKQPDVLRYLGKDRPFTIPSIPDTFRALNEMQTPGTCKVVIFGQDPYPREESAVGIAFHDGAIKQWSNSLNPSIRNIIKNCLYSEGHVDAKTKVEEVRSKLKELKVLEPPHWFENTMHQGVLWLNTALTFSAVDKDELNKHTAFWRPIVDKICESLIEAQQTKVKQDAQAKAGIVFVLFGGNAKKLKKTIETLNKKYNVPLRFIEAKHPAVDGIHEKKVFEEVNKNLKELQLEPVNWLPTGTSSTTTSSSATEDSKKRKQPDTATAVEEQGQATKKQKK